MISILTIGFAFLTLIYWTYKRLTRISIAQVPGPIPESFLLGNFRELLQGQAGELDFKWQAQFGNIIRIKAPLGEDRLMISDPKTLHYIYQTSGYNFIKHPERREILRIIGGKGLGWVDGDDHKRHRKVMLPGFSAPEAKAYVPIFSAYASKVGETWRDIITASPDQSSVFNIPSWISRATLDAIGKVAFDYEFGAMDQADNALGNAYSNLMLDTFGTPTNGQIFSQNILARLPLFVGEFIADHMPSDKLRRSRVAAKIAYSVSKSLVESKSEALLQKKGNKDVMSLLVKANASENKKTQLSEEELLSQMRTIMLAGHETTANTLSWMLLEISKTPSIQAKLRHEIKSMENTIRLRGDSEFSAGDFDAMPYLSAFLKESLRFYPVSPINLRQASKDDVLPLSVPLTTISGEVINELPIPKGLGILTSVNGYNRNKDVFGADADIFDPERWLDFRVKKSSSLGVLGNLMTFSSGVRSCIGWKFAVMELQAFLVELVGNFEFSLTPEAEKIRKESAFVMVPTVMDQEKEGSQLPLRVRIVPKE